MLPLDRLGEFFKGAFGAISAKMSGFKSGALTAVALQAFFFWEKMAGFKSGSLAAGFFLSFFAGFFTFIYLFLRENCRLSKAAVALQRTSYFLLY